MTPHCRAALPSTLLSGLGARPAWCAAGAFAKCSGTFLLNAQICTQSAPRRHYLGCGQAACCIAAQASVPLSAKRSRTEWAAAGMVATHFGCTFGPKQAAACVSLTQCLPYNDRKLMRMQERVRRTHRTNHTDTQARSAPSAKQSPARTWLACSIKVMQVRATPLVQPPSLIDSALAGDSASMQQLGHGQSCDDNHDEQSCDRGAQQ